MKGLAILLGAIVSAALTVRVIQLDANLADTQRELATVPRAFEYGPCGTGDWAKRDHRHPVRCKVGGFVVDIPARDPAAYRDVGEKRQSKGELTWRERADLHHEAIRQLAIAVYTLGAECNPRRRYAPLHLPEGFDVSQIEIGGDERPRGFVTGGAR